MTIGTHMWRGLVCQMQLVGTKHMKTKKVIGVEETNTNIYKAILQGDKLKVSIKFIWLRSKKQIRTE